VTAAKAHGSARGHTPVQRELQQARGGGHAPRWPIHPTRPTRWTSENRSPNS
jgi:hypothetical protein